MADKYRYWSIVFYPESAPNDWLDILKFTGLPIAISPLHDKDVDNDGSFKKPHYHCIVCFSGPTTYNNVLNISSLVGSEVIQPCYSVKGMYDYHIHLYEDDKVHYSDSDRILLNGFCVSNYSQLSQIEIQYIIMSIDDDIVEYGFTEYAQLRLFYKRVDFEKYKFLNNHSLLYKTLFASIRGSGGIPNTINFVNKVIQDNDIEVL